MEGLLLSVVAAYPHGKWTILFLKYFKGIRERSCEMFNVFRCFKSICESLGRKYFSLNNVWITQPFVLIMLVAMFDSFNMEIRPLNIFDHNLSCLWE